MATKYDDIGFCTVVTNNGILMSYLTVKSRFCAVGDKDLVHCLILN